MDSRICQTSTVSPAKPGDFPLLVNCCAQMQVTDILTAAAMGLKGVNE